ncbi:DNA polymerase I [Pleomorphochaeta sp. DL1XJH-081]|uniref:DNA polymerase I n=1 Tax=Pleomorphochaeta sp. DL1XJH-081 TaxID=3409690 RepID=UPI003BB4D78B
MSEKKKPTLYIIDGYGLIYRSYFAFINRPLRDMEGNNVSAMYGFFSTLLMIIREYKPDYLVVAMDTAAPTFRHELYEPYKANRDAAPQDLHSQVPKIHEVLEAANIPHIGMDGWEADDIIASLTTCASKQGIESIMVTGDKDLLQLVQTDVFALRPPRKGEKKYRLVGPDEVLEDFGIRANQVIDYLSLIGDSSDNVPGVAGIGPKGAVKLLQEYGDLNAIYDHIDEMTPSVAKKLISAKELAYLSRTLVTLKHDVVDITDFSTDRFRMDSVDWEKAIPLFEQANAKSLITAVGASLPASTQSEEDEKEDDSSSAALAKAGTYHAVVSLDELKRLLEEMAVGGVMAFDFETTSIDEMVAEPVGFSFTNRSFEAWYVPLVAGGEAYIPAEQAKELLRSCIIEKSVRIIGQNLKYDYKVLERWGVSGANLYFDTMVAAWLLDAASGIYNMDYLAEKYLGGYKTVHYKDVVPKDSLFSDVPLEKAVNYAAEDADITWRLYEKFSKALEKRKMVSLFEDLEMPLVKILSDMELRGISFDRKRLEAFDTDVVKRLSDIERQIYEEVGHEFNINSTKQLQEVLFQERGLPTGKKNKTGFSTATDTLERLAEIDIIPRLILQNRALVKLKNTYIDTLPQMVNHQTNRIHTSYTQTGTATGRLSSRNPNLQNIPIRSEDGRKIRDAFVPGHGHTFLSADYSQIELVVLAHLADDAGLKEAFLHGEDIHTHTAALIFGVHPDLVMPEQRRIAKTINFGVMYGMSAFRLSNELQIPRKDAQTFIENYFARFSGVNDFMRQVREHAEKSGKVSTILGRERAVPEISSRNKMEKASAERIVVNTVIQGSAADIMKLAMLKVVRAMEREGLKTRLLLQVHDELIFEVPDDELTTMQLLVKREMESAYELSIPLRVSMEVGHSWGEMH